MTLYEDTIIRNSSLDKTDNIQEAYENMIMNEGKEEAAAIRKAIKDQFKLTSRDVGVKTRSGGTSSAVNVTLKSVKALPYMQKIKEIGSGHESYQRDMVTQTILAGGNTFIFTELDYRFRDKLVKKIEGEITKNITDEFMNGDGGGNVIKVYGNYKVVKDRSRSDEYWVADNKSSSAGPVIRDMIGAAGRILYLMLKNEDVKNLKKLG